MARTVDVFYRKSLAARRNFWSWLKTLRKELGEIEKTTQMMVKNKKAGPLELDRIALAVHEALLERHDRELALEVSRSKLRPLIGRTAEDPDYELEGKMDVKAVVPPPDSEVCSWPWPTLTGPDLISGRLDIERARANIESERRKARPSVSVVPMWSYQNQEAINGFRNGSLAGIGLSTTLPFTDRNQGNILKARSRERELQLAYHGDRADAFAQVEAAVAEYSGRRRAHHTIQYHPPRLPRRPRI